MHFRLTFTESPTEISSRDGRTIYTQRAPSITPTLAPTPPDHSEIAAQTISRIEDQLSHLRGLIEQQLSQIRTQTLELATSICEAVLNESVESVEKRATHFVSVALQEIAPEVPATIYVHPDCLETISEWLEGIGEHQWHPASDPSVKAGDCRIEMAAGGVSATLDDFIESLKLQATEREHA